MKNFILIILLLIGCKNATESINEDIEIGSVKDIDGNVYKTVKIGEQWWMAENLKVKHDPQGNPITSYVYRNVEENEDIYGRLYKWNDAMNGSSNARSQGIAPDGWHIPSNSEWKELINHIGGKSEAGGKLKESGEEHWQSPNSGAEDLFQFKALPTGWLNFTGEYIGIGERCFFRTSSRASNNYPIVQILKYNSSAISEGDVIPNDAIPIRCIRD